MDQSKLLAQVGTELGAGKYRIGGEGLGPFGNIALDPTVALVAVTRVISNIVGVMTIAAGIWFLLQLLLAGINWISAEGDTKKLQQAQQRITSAFLGLLIVVIGIIFLSLASKFLGYDLLITSPGDLINRLRITP
ncbi:hypothetical protein HYV22_03715 [Candidatus Gottesmanbacteria bacterium]|nr:hypothetical protein [Candidatus Gottesmanbacteria bacterium]